MDVKDIATDFAAALFAVDAKRPIYTSRTGRQYLPGIGPHAEDAVVALTLAEMRATTPARYTHVGQGLPYPGSKQKCDVWIGDPIEWVAEVKMARFFGDNGKPDDTSIKDILSPYDSDRSALTDCVKLVASSLPGRKAVLIYGFEHIPTRRPLAPAIEAFELLASRGVEDLGPRITVVAGDLVHPVFQRATVFAWEVVRVVAQ